MYIAFGFTLTRLKVLSKNASKILSAFLTNFIVPFYSIYNLSRNVTVDKIGSYLSLFGAGIIITLIIILVAIPLAKIFAKNDFEKGIYNYLFAFSNMGYFGYPLVDAVFGEEVLAQFMVFCIPVSLAISSYGYYILTKYAGNDLSEGKALNKVKVKKPVTALYSVPIIGVYIGLFFGLMPFTLPDFVYDVLKPAVDCYSCIPMVIAGVVLAGLPLGKLFTSFKAYIVGIVRLIVMPVFFGAIAYLLYKYVSLPREIVISIVCLVSLPAGMNVIVYPESVGLDSTEGARACFVSYIMGLATIPVVFMILEKLVGSI